MDVNIYIYFSAIFVLLPSVMRRGGEVLKSGFLEGKKIKPICFYVSALGRCKVTGEQEEPEEFL